ncbi:glycosyltransferase family 4 protein [Arthrobacter sp. D1-17]
MNSPQLSRGQVGILSQWYAPEPVLIPKSVSDSLVADGYAVRVLTGYPNYPGGELYADYSASAAEATDIDGARVLRIPSFMSHDQRAPRRIRSFLSFARNSVRHRRFLRDCDVLYVYGTPMTAAAAAFILRVGNKVPYVIHLQDLWPESVVDSGMIRSRSLRCILQFAITASLLPLYRAAEHIVVISPGMKSTLIQRGVDADKITVLLNWDASELDSEPQDPVSDKAGPGIHCVYAGNIGQMQDVNTIIRAAAEVQHELDLDVSIYGSGVAEAEARALADELDARNVHFMGRVSLDEMKSVYRRSDYQLVTLKDRRVFGMTIPSKFQASMANGVPVITTVPGDLAKLCSDKDVGLVADPEDPDSLADAFRQAASLGRAGRENMANKARSYYKEALSADKTLSAIKAILFQAAKAE